MISEKKSHDLDQRIRMLYFRVAWLRYVKNLFTQSTPVSGHSVNFLMFNLAKTWPLFHFASSILNLQKIGMSVVRLPKSLATNFARILTQTVIVASKFVDHLITHFYKLE